MRFGDVDSQGEVSPIPLPTDFNIDGQVQGDVLYFNGSEWVRLAPGTADQSLRTQGAAANPVWANVDNATNLSISGETTGDMLYYNGANWVRLAASTSGDILTANGAGVAPTWETPAGGDGSAIASFRGVNGGGQSSVNGGICTNYTETFDTGGDFNPTTGIFTCPQTGIYLFSFTSNINNTVSHSGNTQNRVYLDGVNIAFPVNISPTNRQAIGGSVVSSKSSGNNVSAYLSTNQYPLVGSTCNFSGTLLA